MSDVYDIIGCGFGPANLALAVAIAEQWLSAGRENCVIRRVCFIEKHPRFLWHPGMLLPDTVMQISFLKDLATLRNPTSSFSFLSYLSAHNRLVSFINRGSFIPTRREFSDYLTWASIKVQELGVEVYFGEQFLSVHPDLEHGAISCTSHKGGHRTARLTKNLVLAPGGVPRIPACLSPVMNSPQAMHTSTYASSILKALETFRAKPRALRVAIVGSGQSAAEVFLNLKSRLADMPPPTGQHELDLIIRKGSLKPSDDSPFANEIFDPDATDRMYSLNTDVARARLLDEYRNTNYGVVNPKTIDVLYECMYNQKVAAAAHERRNGSHEDISPVLNIVAHQAVVGSCIGSDAGITLTIQHTLTRVLNNTKPYDILVLGTGYQRNMHLKLIEESQIGKYFFAADGPSGPTSAGSMHISVPPTPSDYRGSNSLQDELETPMAQRMEISRNYCLVPIKPFTPRVYLQGGSEGTHGISDTLLSVAAVRAGEILSDIIDKDKHPI